MSEIGVLFAVALAVIVFVVQPLLRRAVQAIPGSAPAPSCSRYQVWHDRVLAVTIALLAPTLNFAFDDHSATSETTMTGSNRAVEILERLTDPDVVLRTAFLFSVVLALLHRCPNALPRRSAWKWAVIGCLPSLLYLVLT